MLVADGLSPNADPDREWKEGGGGGANSRGKFSWWDLEISIRWAGIVVGELLLEALRAALNFVLFCSFSIYFYSEMFQC